MLSPSQLQRLRDEFVKSGLLKEPMTRNQSAFLDFLLNNKHEFRLGDMETIFTAVNKFLKHTKPNEGV